MKTLFLFALIIIGMFFNSCKNNVDSPEEIVKIDLFSKETNAVNLEMTSFVQLETLDSSLIRGINKIEIYSDFIYVFDKSIKALFVFDKNGKFIGRTKNGKGPGECINPWDFIVDKDNQRILLWDQGSYNMIEYDLKLNYLTSKHYKGLVIRNFKKLSKETFLAFIQYPILNDSIDNRTLYNYVIYDKDFTKPISKMLPTTRNLAQLSSNSPISPKDRALFVAPCDNNIYGLENNNLKVIYNIDFGKCNITSEDLAKGISTVFSLARKGERTGPIDNIFENKNYLSFAFFYKGGPLFCIHKKKTNLSYLSNDLIREQKLPDCLIFGILDNDIFISSVEAGEFMKYSKRMGLTTNGVKEFDNPIIMYFRIKD